MVTSLQDTPPQGSNCQRSPDPLAFRNPGTSKRRALVSRGSGSAGPPSGHMDRCAHKSISPASGHF